MKEIRVLLLNGSPRANGNTALALRELYDSLMRTPKAEDENPAMIFDRAAERVCRGCSLRTICWERDYAKTYNALNDATAALLRRGQGRGEDFPSYFSERCIHFSSFLSAVNGELRAYLLRRQYRRQHAQRLHRRDHRRHGQAVHGCAVCLRRHEPLWL